MKLKVAKVLFLAHFSKEDYDEILKNPEQELGEYSNYTQGRDYLFCEPALKVVALAKLTFALYEERLLTKPTADWALGCFSNAIDYMLENDDAEFEPELLTDRCNIPSIS
jgi:hypothetical protein